MKILLLNAYFIPEIIAFTHLEQDLIRGMLDAGHEIEVLCPIPTRGISEETAQKYKLIREETIFDGRVHVKRFWAPREGRNPLMRAFRYFWCNYRQYQMGKKYRGVDLIFAVSTPPTQGLLAGILSRKLNCRFLYSLQDVFPDSLVTTGLTYKGSLLWKIGRKVENTVYGYADQIVVISQSIRRNLLEKGVSDEKLQVISNWIDVDAIRCVAKEDNRLFEEFGIPRDKFTVVYAGNFGAAQGADVVLDTAHLLSDRNDIQFVIFGGGAEFEKAKSRAQKMPNVTIHGLLPQERVPEVYSLGDVAVITCKKGVGNSGMPSKTWSIMACGTPIAASFDTDSELAQVIAQANAGLCVESGDAQALVRAIQAVYEAPGQYNGGREYVCENASRQECVKRYLRLLETEGTS